MGNDDSNSMICFFDVFLIVVDKVDNGRIDSPSANF